MMKTILDNFLLGIVVNMKVGFKKMQSNQILRIES